MADGWPRGGYLGYAMWRRYLRLAHGFTAAHPDGAVSYTAHELRHVCASLLIASGASDMQVAPQMGHSKIETTKNIYGHLLAQDRTAILDALNQAVSRLHAYETDEPHMRGAAAEWWIGPMLGDVAINAAVMVIAGQSQVGRSVVSHNGMPWLHDALVRPDAFA